MIHRMLERQLRKAGIAQRDQPISPEAFESFLERISRAYCDFDNDRYLLERSLEQVSAEMRDLNEALRRSKEQELAVERDKLQAIISALGDGLATLDGTGRITSMNPAGRRMLGLTDGHPEHINQLCSCFIENIQRLEAGLRSGVQVRIDNAQLCAGPGREIPVSLSLDPLPGTDGAVLLFHDMSEARAAEAAQRQAREEAELHSRLKSEFLANMSHEIRTPMNAVIGMAGLLIESPLNPDQREMAGIVRSSGQHLLALLNSVLDFSKIEAGKLELERLPFDPRAVAEEVLEMFAERAASQDMELIASLPLELPDRVVGDPYRLRQILINLVGNALKFTEQGSVRLEVAVHAVDGSAGATGKDGLGEVELHWMVHDTGIGIEPSAARHIFDPFIQAEGGTTRRFGGTGLGLAISRQLVELMGGQIGHRDAPGGVRGSTFWFRVRLPVAAGGDPIRKPNLGERRVLVICADPHTSLALTAPLRAWGAQVEEAATGMVAFMAINQALMTNQPYDLVIADARLPGISGMDISRAIRGDPRTLNWKVAVCERLGVTLDAATLKTAKIAGVISRPIRIGPLAQAIQTILEPASAVVTSPGAIEAARPARRHRVLVAEDNPVNQLLARRILANLDLEVEVANDGQAAVEAWSRGGFDLILMDCMMPGMDGYDATREIRRREQGRGTRVPIIAMTANALTGARESCLSAGMDDYLSKPVEPAILRRALDRYLSMSAPTPVVAQSATEARSAWNPNTLRGYLGPADDSNMITVLQGYLTDGNRRVADLRRASEKQELRAIFQAAHALSGASGYVGAEEVQDQASELADLSKTGREIPQSMIEQLETAWARLHREVATWMGHNT